MRKTMLLVSLLLVACSTMDSSPKPVTSTSNADRVRGVYAAFARGEVPAVLAALDPNIVWMEAENINYADRNPYRGPQAVLEGVFMRLGQDWNDFKVTLEQVVDGGDTVVALGRYTATNKATGQPLNAQFAHVWSLRDGKMVRFQQYADTAQFAKVTGAWR